MDMDTLRNLAISSRDLWHVLGISGLLLALIVFLLAINCYSIEPWKKRRKDLRGLNQVSHQHLEQIKLLKGNLKAEVIGFRDWTRAQSYVTNLQGQLLKADILWAVLHFYRSGAFPRCHWIFHRRLFGEKLFCRDSASLWDGFDAFLVLKKKKEPENFAV